MKRNLLSAALLAAGLFMGGHAFALEQDEAGVYQIGTAQDLVDFATLVNDATDDVDNTEACAVLTADIDLTDVTWTPIGNGDRRYKGTFDGQFHSIKNMTLTPTVKEQGLFGVVANATIKYVIIDKSCTVRAVDVPCFGALVGCCNGKGTLTIIGCVNYANVIGSKANNSAFVGCNYSSGNLKVEIIYCVNYGNISGGWENGVFCGWFAGASKIYGSLNLGSVADHQGDLTLGRGHGSLADYVNTYDFNTGNNANAAFVYADYTDEIAKSGQLCYELNCYEGLTGWFQNLGEDDQPTLDPTHKQVYASGERYCDGTPKAAFTYTNDPDQAVKTDDHQFENGYCKNCHTPDPNFLEKDAEGFYLIGTPEEFMWFADYAVSDGTISAKLTADLDFSGVTNFNPIGFKGEYFRGTLDGQFHRIKNLVINKSEDNWVGLISNITDGATICNMIMDSSCTIIGYSYVAAFVGGSQGSGKAYFYGLGNEADVSTSDAIGGGKNIAGIIGVSNGGSCAFIINNCYNTGNITGGNESAAITGWFGGGSEIYGCYNTGEILGAQGNNSMWRNSCTYYHVWDLNTDNLRQPYNVMDDFDEAMWASGEFCYNLNGTQENIGWYQNLGTDPKPVLDPTHAKVYPKGGLNCDGSPKEGVTYTNTDGQYTRDDHEYDNGFCINCGKSDPAAALEQDAEGFYHITNGGEFAIFAAITASDPTASCKLEDDIDMDGIAWSPIGNASPFKGIIDGQQHEIKNLFVSDPSSDYQGLVGTATGGCIVCNLILDESCSIEGKAYSAGLIGGSSGSGNITIENCGNEANVTGSGANIAGIIGVNMGSSAHFIITNCYNTGIITGGIESAAISGWLGSDAELKTVWNSGSATGISDGCPLYRGSYSSCENSFAIDGQSQAGFGSFTIDDLESGAFCYFLNGEVSGGDAWTQTLDEDYWPVPFNNHGKIYTAGTLLCDGSIDPDGEFGYSNEEGTVITPDHEWEDGVCQNCGDADPTWKEADEDGWYSISNEKELAWFGGMIKIGNTDIKGRLTDDIDLSGMEWRPMGTEKNPFCGTFDGQNHYIDNMEVMGTQYLGLFGYVTGGADFKNFIVSGSVTGEKFLAGIAGGSTGSGVIKFTNIGNEASVYGTAQNAAGIIGVSMGSSCTFLIHNCYNAGDITGGRESAAFSGWMGQPESEIFNCYNIGTITGYDEGKPIYRYDGTQIKDLVSINEDSQQGIVLGEESVASGELAFYVNGMQAEGTHFFQTLGEDDYPVPFKEGHETVYAHGKLLCDGSVDVDGLSFANEPGEFEHAEHQFGEDGCCELCGNAWGISTAEQLLEFSHNVQAYITNEAEAYLLNDIDLKDVEWEPIGYGGTTSSGTDDCIPYGGKFDGQGHRIYNMVIDDQSRMFLGFFGCLTGGAEVKNLTIDKSCYVHGNAYCAGFAGGSKLNGNILFENCGNECDVVCDGDNGANAAGFVGCNMNSSATFIIKNCFNTGNIKGLLESGSFSGWLGSNARVTNSWNTGSVEGIQDGRPFARFNSATFMNCYDLSGTQDNVERLTASAVTSGELCYKLNEGNTEDPIWRQTIGTDPYPAFNPASGIVYFVDYTYTNDPTNVQPINNDPEATISSVFTLQGVRTDEMQRGINIVRMSDGTVRKVLVK